MIYRIYCTSWMSYVNEAAAKRPSAPTMVGFQRRGIAGRLLANAVFSQARQRLADKGCVDGEIQESLISNVAKRLGAAKNAEK